MGVIFSLENCHFKFKKKKVKFVPGFYNPDLYFNKETHPTPSQATNLTRFATLNEREK